MKVRGCVECGASLEGRPSECPLCGARQVRPVARDAVDVYQRKVRTLRADLERLRDEGVEAV